MAHIRMKGANIATEKDGLKLLVYYLLFVYLTQAVSYIYSISLAVIRS